MICLGSNFAPTIEASVGNTSIFPAIWLHWVPAGIFPGQRMMQGSLTPPSKLLPFFPLNGPAEPVAGPLSEVKITKVFSSSPSSLIVFITCPTDQSISSITSPNKPEALFPLNASEAAIGP